MLKKFSLILIMLFLLKLALLVFTGRYSVVNRVCFLIILKWPISSHTDYETKVQG